MIGRNPRRAHNIFPMFDVWGIHLKVWIALNASYVNKSYLEEAFRLTSHYVFDYTDGYVFISKIEFVDTLDEANVVVADWGPTKWKGASKMGFGFARLNIYHLGDDPKEFAAVAGHELGHLIFCFGDEYYYVVDNVEVFFPDDLQEELSDRGVCTVMGLGKVDPSKAIDVCELSSMYDYEIFTELAEKYGVAPKTHHWQIYGKPCWATFIEMLHPVIFYWKGKAYWRYCDELLYYRPLPGPHNAVELYVMIVW